VRAIEKLRCHSSKKRMGVQDTDLVLENLAASKLRYAEAQSN
jgi:hypothetical protein